MSAVRVESVRLAFAFSRDQSQRSGRSLLDAYQDPDLRPARRCKGNRSFKREALEFEHDAIALVRQILIQMESPAQCRRRGHV